jgi:WD40 repeat protein
MTHTFLIFGGTTNILFLIFHIVNFSLNFLFVLCLLPDETHYKKFDEYDPKDEKSSSTEKSKSHSNNPSKSSPTSGKSNKRGNLKKRTDKSNYSHNWLLTTLKGHTGAVLDMDFSANGKYLATCADGECEIIKV